MENGCISNLSFLSCRVIFALNHDYLGERVVSNQGFVFSGTFWLSTALFLMLLSFRFHSAKRLREDPPSHLKPIKHRSPLISAVKSSQAFSPSQDKLFTPHARGEFLGTKCLPSWVTYPKPLRFEDDFPFLMGYVSFLEGKCLCSYA